MTAKRLRVLALAGWTLATAGLLVSFRLLWVESRDFSYVASLERVATELSSQISGREMTIAVLPFSDFGGNTSQLGTFISDALTIALVRSDPGLHIVSRSKLEELWAEVELDARGLIEPNTRLTLGRMPAAEALLVGKIDLTSERLVLAVSLVDLETAETIGAAAATLIATKRMQELGRLPATNVTADLQQREITRLQHEAAARPQREALGTLLLAFAVKNWPWIWTVLLVPVFTWAVARTRRRTKAEASAPQESA